MTKPTVTIRYAGDPPAVSVEPVGSVEIKLIDGEEEGTRVIDYQDVQVYRTWSRHQDILSDWWMSVYVGRSSDDDEDIFNFISLPRIPDAQIERYEKLFPDNAEAQALAYAIDQKWLTQEGYTPPPS